MEVEGATRLRMLLALAAACGSGGWLRLVLRNNVQSAVVAPEDGPAACTAALVHLRAVLASLRATLVVTGLKASDEGIQLAFILRHVSEPAHAFTTDAAASVGQALTAYETALGYAVWTNDVNDIVQSVTAPSVTTDSGPERIEGEIDAAGARGGFRKAPCHDATDPAGDASARAIAMQWEADEGLADVDAASALVAVWVAGEGGTTTRVRFFKKLTDANNAIQSAVYRATGGKRTRARTHGVAVKKTRRPTQIIGKSGSIHTREGLSLQRGEYAAVVWVLLKRTASSTGARDSHIGISGAAVEEAQQMLAAVGGRGAFATTLSDAAAKDDLIEADADEGSEGGGEDTGDTDGTL